jgi:uncharacterized protein YecT (DUF1311 family)
MRPSLAVVFLFAVISSPVVAQTANAPALPRTLTDPWRARCEQALQTPLPLEAGVAPLPDTAKAGAVQFYYGIGDQTQDFAAARATAWQQRVAVATHPGGYGMFSGTLLLAMIYANGEGTPRDPLLALRMGCEATNYPNNLTSADLDALQAALTSGARYDVCAAGSPEESNGPLCGWLNVQRNLQRVHEAVRAQSADWLPAQKADVAALQKAADRFVLTSAIWEAPAVDDRITANTDLSQAWNRHETELEDKFLADFGTLGQSPSPGNEAEADAALNKSYRALMDRLRSPGKQMPPTIVLNTLQEQGTERDWIAYRDAWVALAEARLGPEKAAALRTELTRQRGATLKKIAEAYGPPDADVQPWLAMCARVRSAALPADIAAEPSPPHYPVCSSYKPYYGIGMKVDFAAARSCAIAERNLIQFGRNINIGYENKEPGAEIGEAINGALVLTMLYSNGEGVARNVALAQRFACEAIDDGQIAVPEAFATDDQTAAIYPDLLKAIASGDPKRLDMCGYVPALGRNEDECDLIGMVQADEKRRAALEGLKAKFTPEQATAYDQLLAALREYLAAHDQNEIYVMPHELTGGGWDGEHAAQEQAFLDAMERFEKGELPRAGAAEYAAADKGLNAAYAKVMAVAPAAEEGGGEHPTGGQPTRASVRATEKMWIAYRDAFAEFGVMRYPGTTRDAWLTYVTRQRTNALNPCMADPSCEQ